MRHLSAQVYGVDAQIRQLVAGLPSGPSGAPTSEGDPPPTFSSIVASQRAMSDRLEHMSRRQGKIEQSQRKFREHEKKKSKFLNKMMDKLRSLYGSGAFDDDLSSPSGSSS